VVATPTTTGATEEYDGTSWTAGGSLNTARYYLGGCRNSNSSFSFWWTIHLLQQQQKNTMEQLGQLLQVSLNTARE
jgi:hypothetical protein